MTSPPPLRQLAESWLEKASICGELGATSQAAVLTQCAEDIHRILEQQEAEPLTLHESAAVSGYSASQLRRLLASGTLANVGDDRGPRIRRGDLPRKPGRLTDRERRDHAVQRLRVS